MYTIQTSIPRPEGDLAIKFAFPTNDQWIRRQDSRRRRSVNLGRGKNKEEDVPGALDAEILVECLQLEEGQAAPQISSAEAAQVLNAIAEISISDIARHGTCYEVEFEDCMEQGYRVEVRVPTRDELEEYRRDLVRIKSVDGNTTVVSVNLRAVESLWAKLGGKDLPVVWKASVLGRIADAVGSLAMTRVNP